MKEVRYSTKAKKDLKKYRNDLAKMHDLFVVLSTLASYVERVGSHSELFK